MKDNKGITLIALVITIIVMLILVTVTIQVATNGNLFKHAGNAAKETKKAAEEENALADGNVGDKSIDEIVDEATGESGESATSTVHFAIAADGEYDVSAGTTWAEWAEEQDNYSVTEQNRISNGDPKGSCVMLNGDYVDASSAIENESYTVGNV